MEFAAILFVSFSCLFTGHHKVPCEPLFRCAWRAWSSQLSVSRHKLLPSTRDARLLGMPHVLGAAFKELFPSLAFCKQQLFAVLLS